MCDERTAETQPSVQQRPLTVSFWSLLSFRPHAHDKKVLWTYQDGFVLVINTPTCKCDPLSSAAAAVCPPPRLFQAKAGEVSLPLQAKFTGSVSSPETSSVKQNVKNRLPEIVVSAVTLCQIWFLGMTDADIMRKQLQWCVLR